MSKPDFGKLMEEAMSNNREEQEQIGYQMLREGGHSVKEIAEAMGVTSLHEVSVLIEKYNEKQLAKGKPPAVLGGAVKIPKDSTAPIPGPIVSSVGGNSSSVDVMLNDDDRALVDRIALNALLALVKEMNFSESWVESNWRKALGIIDTWLVRMLPEIRKATSTVHSWSWIAAAIAAKEIKDDE
ncbi:MAG: hypothetical protein KH295_03145 [Clostridiaceae bacterium]|nr:hypothetical protein [Clostridiaceae bacterium]